MIHTFMPRHSSSRCALATLLASLALAATAAAQEKLPKEGESALVVTGCLKGRVLTVTGNPNEQGQIVRQDVMGRSFRLNGKKDVIEVVKKNDGNLVEVRGIVRTADLATPAGVNIGGTNVKIGITPVDPTARNRPMQEPLMNVIIMDITSVTFVDEGCPIGKR
jgi:hypothetical protein